MLVALAGSGKSVLLAWLRRIEGAPVRSRPLLQLHRLGGVQEGADGRHRRNYPHACCHGEHFQIHPQMPVLTNIRTS